MFWIWIALIAAALLAFALTALRRYERESAAAARQELSVLRQELEALAQRVQNLETIASAESRVPPLGEAPSSDENISVSSRGRAPS